MSDYLTGLFIVCVIVIGIFLFVADAITFHYSEIEPNGYNTLDELAIEHPRLSTDIDNYLDDGKIVTWEYNILRQRYNELHRKQFAERHAK